MRGRTLAILLAAAGCSGSADATVIDVADPGSARQLVSGFHQVERDYRWTAGRFEVLLKPPRHASQSGARLIMELYVADELIAKNRDTTLDCSIDGAALAPERYVTAGSQRLVRDTPPLVSNPATLRCALSHPLPPGPVDNRELGIVVSKIRLLDR